uniref:Uncharacterized protein n=1 Tax=Panagrolaimus superbus TaxID=310955 RepID=A0A914YY60_9BILA
MAESEENADMGFVELVKSYLNQMVEPDGYYDDISIHERRKKLLEAEGLPLPPDDCEEDVSIPKSKYVENPSPDAEVPNFDKKQLPPQLLQYKYGDAIPFDDDQKEFLEKSREHWKVIGETEKRMFEQHYGEKALKSIYHPDNRGRLPYWLPQP